jgi:hypothetical protein
MGNFSEVATGRFNATDWVPVCSNSLVEIPTSRPLILMENRRTRQRAFYDIKYNRIISQQRAQGIMNGDLRYLD